MPRPAIGICAAVERARFGTWDLPAVLLPRTYADALQRAGGIALMLPPDPVAAVTPDEVLDRVDALLLAGGTDIDPAVLGAEAHPETAATAGDRDRFELGLAARALERGMPVLGICRGMQALNVAAGGSLVQHLPDLVGHDGHRPTPGRFAEHDVTLRPGSLAARAAGAEKLSVKTHHHQGVDEIGPGLEASGWSVGDEVVEAVEGPGPGFALGVLWHPEEDDEAGGPLLEALVKAATANEED